MVDTRWTTSKRKSDVTEDTNSSTSKTTSGNEKKKKKKRQQQLKFTPKEGPWKEDMSSIKRRRTKGK